MTVCSMIPLPKILYIHRVGQNHIYTVYIRYFWLGNHQIYGVYIRIYTVLANPIYTLSICGSGQPFGRIYIKPEGSLSKMHEHRPRYHKNNGFAATTMPRNTIPRNTIPWNTIPWKQRFRCNHDAIEHDNMEQQFCCQLGTVQNCLETNGSLAASGEIVWHILLAVNPWYLCKRRCGISARDGVTSLFLQGTV